MSVIRWSVMHRQVKRALYTLPPFVLWRHQCWETVEISSTHTYPFTYISKSHVYGWMHAHTRTQMSVCVFVCMWHIILCIICLVPTSMWECWCGKQIYIPCICSVSTRKLLMISFGGYLWFSSNSTVEDKCTFLFPLGYTLFYKTRSVFRHRVLLSFLSRPPLVLSFAVPSSLFFSIFSVRKRWLLIAFLSLEEVSALIDLQDTPDFYLGIAYKDVCCLHHTGKRKNFPCPWAIDLA